MTISSSFTYNESIDSSNKVSGFFFSLTSCSEYPALNWNYNRVVLFPFYALSETHVKPALVKLFGVDYTLKQYMIDYINMVYDIMTPINERNEEKLFELYTFGDLKVDRADVNKRINSNTSFNIRYGDTSILKAAHDSNVTTPETEFKDDEPIGIATNVNKIRKACGAQSTYNSLKTQTCRKVQLAHTMLRLIYSTGWQIALISLKLYKDYKIDPFYALWMGYNLRHSYDIASSDYGDCFKPNDGFMTKEEFVKRFFDSKLNGSVQQHFSKQNNQLMEYGATIEADNLDKSSAVGTHIIGKNPSSWTVVLDALQKGDLFENINSLLTKCIESINNNTSKVTFTFSKKLFEGALINVKYDGLELPNSKLGRIVFKDENEVVLSILKKSKFIQIS